MNLPVTDDGIRPSGKPDECFYCGFKKGSHEKDCVCLDKTVVLEMTIRYIASVPQDWTQKEIEFHRNDGTYCLNNDISKLAADIDYIHCYCNHAKVKYLREATEEDHKELGFTPEEYEEL